MAIRNLLDKHFNKIDNSPFFAYICSEQMYKLNKGSVGPDRTFGSKLRKSCEHAADRRMTISA